MVRVVRGIGWLLIVSGAIVLLYVVYLLWFTGFEAEQAQRDLERRWSDSITVPDGPELVYERDIDLGDAYAALWFERDGERILNDRILYVVEGVTLDLLRSGPGHYPESDHPGGPGNVAVAGHRTTYGAPFWALDELTGGDTIHVLDRNGDEWVYAFTEQQVVAPADVWVVGHDPLGTGAPTITLTTCHPRFSANQRLIAWGELIGDPRLPANEDGQDAADDDAEAADQEELPES